MKYIFILYCGGIFIASTINNQVLHAQEPDSVRIRKLEEKVTALEKIIQQQQETGEMQKLIDEANQLTVKEEEAAPDISKKFFSGARQQQGLNPNISVCADFFGGFSSSNAEYLSIPGPVSYGNNGFHLREGQVSFIAPLDPFTRGKAFFSAGETGMGIDEIYLEWLNLPLHLNLKVGYFNAEFGWFNRYHDHALPQFDRPRALINLFSNEPLAGVGFNMNFLLPIILFSNASILDVGVINGGNDFSFSGSWNSGLVLNAHFKNFYELNANQYFEFILSGSGGRNNQPGDVYRSYVGSFGIAYKWVPVGREKYRTFDWRTEFLYSYQESSEGSISSYGYYTSIQNKLNARMWLSGRIGYSQLPFDPSQYEWDFTCCFDFWQSEFVMTRVQYQYNHREIYNTWFNGGPVPSDHSFIIQVIWAMGPHKHEAY